MRLSPFVCFSVSLAFAACEDKAPPAAPQTSQTAAPAPTAAATAAAAEAKPALKTLPGKLDKPLGESTPEDIEKAVEANGIKADLKKWDRQKGKEFDKYSVSWGEKPFWINLWISVDAPEGDRPKASPGGRPVASEGKIAIEVDASADAEARHDEGQRVLSALLGK